MVLLILKLYILRLSINRIPVNENEFKGKKYWFLFAYFNYKAFDFGG